MNSRDISNEPVEVPQRISSPGDSSCNTACDVDPFDDRLDQLAEEFLDRYRDGERPSVAEYTEKYPDLADEIRDLFPTIAQMEGLKVQFEDEHPSGPADEGAVAGQVPMSRLGDFRIIREVGRGGMGVVYEAEQTSLGRRVAVKVLPLLSVSQPELVRRFQREARTAARLHHTNIVPVFGVGQADGFHYYVMQLIDGVGLDSYVEDGCETLTGSSARPAAEHSGAVEAREVTLVDIDSRNLPADQERVPKETQSESESAALNNDASSTEDDAQSSNSDTVKHADLPADGTGRETAAMSRSERATYEDLLKDDSTTLSLPSLPKLNPENVEDEDSADPPQTPPTSPNSTATATCLESESGLPVPTPSQKRNDRALKRLENSEIVSIGIQAADSLHYAHEQGTLHRDIKPGNLLLDDEGVVWVTDFGLAKAMEGDDITHSENVVGTVRYMAPEQFKGAADARSDIYSLGLTLYELLARRRAWTASRRSGLINQVIAGDLTPLRKANPSIPRDLDTVIQKATARDVQHRYQTAGEFAADLRRFAEDRPIHARRVEPHERLWRWARRNPLIASLSTATMVSLLLFAIAAMIGYSAERQQRERVEATATLALEALDRIFDRFTPGSATAASGTSLTADSGADSGRAVLSPEAAKMLEGMLEFYERLAGQSGKTPQLMLKCAQARQRVGDIYHRLGQYESAITSYNTAISEYTTVKQVAHRLDEGLFDEPALIEACLLNGIGSCQLMLARPKEAQATHQKAMVILTGLPEQTRLQPDIRFELARTHSMLAWRLRPGETAVASGSHPAAGEFSEGPGGFEPGRRPPFPGGRGRDFDGPFGRRPRNQHPDGRPPHDPGGPEGDLDAERRQHFAQATQILEPLTNDFPDEARFRFLLALCLRESSPEVAAGTVPELNRACELLESLVNQYPDNAEYRLALAESYARIDVHQHARDASELEMAEASLALAAEHARRLVEEHPTVPAYSASLIHIYNRLATTQESRADFGPPHERVATHAEAERNLRAALELQESLLRRSPESTSYHLWAARFRNSLTRLLRFQNRHEESRQMAEYAIDRLNEIPTSGHDGSYRTRGDLYRNLSITLRQMGDVEGAVDAMLSSEEQFDLTAESRPRHAPPPDAD